MKKLTDAEFKTKLANNNPFVEAIGEYINSSTPIRCICKICGNEMDANPARILRGAICRTCAIKRNSDKARKTNEEFLNDLHDKNPDVTPLEEYLGNKVKILVKCNTCGNTWRATPANLLSGRSCRLCGIEKCRNALRLSNDEFIERVQAINPNIEVLEDYINTTTKIEFKCKICNYMWRSRAGAVLSGHGCPNCGGSKRKEHSTFITELMNINPFIEVLDTYINARTKILCRCTKCNNKWYAAPDKLLQGIGCPQCDKRNKTSFPEQAVLFYILKFFPDAINRYHGDLGAFEIDVYIPKIKLGIEYNGVYYHKNPQRDIIKYTLCKNIGIKLISIVESNTQIINTKADKAILRQKPYNYKTLDECIIDLLNYLDCKADVNTYRDSISIREMYYSNLGKSSLEAKFPDIALEWLYSKNGQITPKMVSYGCNDKYWWKCKECNHEWEATISDRTCSGKGCPVCKTKKIAKKLSKTNEEFVSELKEINPYIIPLENYQRTHTNILFKCLRCENEWKAAPANVLRGKDCPICSRIRGVEKMTITKRNKANNQS